MATSKAQIRANVEYNRRHDSITIRPDKAIGARIRRAASISGQSVQAYILDTLRARMDAEGISKDTIEEEPYED